MIPFRLAALAAAIAVAAPAAAAPKPAPTAPPRTPAATTAPQARPSPAPAPVPREAPPAVLPNGVRWFGAGVGALSAFGKGKGMALQLDYGILRTPPSWRKLALEWHLIASFARPTGETELSASVVPPIGFGSVQIDAGSEDFNALLFEVIPTARALWTITGGVAFFGDAGLGLAQTVERYERTEMFQGHAEWGEYATGFVLRLALGLAADVTPRWRLMFQPLAFELQLGPKFSAFTPALGLAYRL